MDFVLPFFLFLKTYVKYVRRPLDIDLACVRSYVDGCVIRS
jgi:hypothetical protein